MNNLLTTAPLLPDYDTKTQFYTKRNHGLLEIQLIQDLVQGMYKRNLKLSVIPKRKKIIKDY